MFHVMNDHPSKILVKIHQITGPNILQIEWERWEVIFNCRTVVYGIDHLQKSKNSDKIPWNRAIASQQLSRGKKSHKRRTEEKEVAGVKEILKIKNLKSYRTSSPLLLT